MTFEEMMTELEVAVETAFRNEDKFVSDNAMAVLDALSRVQVAIDEWRQG